MWDLKILCGDEEKEEAMTPGFKVEELHNKSCPKCGIGFLRRVIINSQPVTYYCVARKFGDKNCGFKFDVESIKTESDGAWLINGKAVNPEYVDKLSSSSFAENISISVQLEANGVKFFLDPEYVMEKFTASEVQQLKNDSSK